MRSDGVTSSTPIENPLSPERKILEFGSKEQNEIKENKGKGKQTKERERKQRKGRGRKEERR